MEAYGIAKYPQPRQDNTLILSYSHLTLTLTYAPYLGKLTLTYAPNRKLVLTIAPYLGKLTLTYASYLGKLTLTYASYLGKLTLTYAPYLEKLSGPSLYRRGMRAIGFVMFGCWSRTYCR